MGRIHRECANKYKARVFMGNGDDGDAGALIALNCKYATELGALPVALECFEGRDESALACLSGECKPEGCETLEFVEQIECVVCVL